MVSHCTASLKLTPWHEGTFASSVIYSPPPPSLPSSCVNPPLSLSSLPLAPASKMTFIILSLSRSHSFPAARELRDEEKGRKRGALGPNHSSAGCHGGNGSSSLCDPRPLLKMAASCTVEAAALPTLWGNTAACMRHRLLGASGREGDCLSESPASSLTDMLGLLAAMVHTIRRPALLPRIKEGAKWA